MNLLYGELVELFSENGMRFGKVQIGGVLKKVTLDLLTGVTCGDRVLLCDGVAIGKVSDAVESDENHVSRDPR